MASFMAMAGPCSWTGMPGRARRDRDPAGAGTLTILETVRKMLGGGSDELGRDDLLRRVADGICLLKTYGARATELFPPAVKVRVTVANGAVGLIQSMLEDPAFDQEIEARVLNRMVSPRRHALPLRRYSVSAGISNLVQVEEDDSTALARLRIEGGDRDGQVHELPSLIRELRLGRGSWHGAEQRVRNDIILTESLPWVSRAAAILKRSGPYYEVESRDQKQFLAVLRPDGSRVRPEMAASGRVPFRPGDCIELVDGQDSTIRLHLEL